MVLKQAAVLWPAGPSCHRRRGMERGKGEGGRAAPAEGLASCAPMRRDWIMLERSRFNTPEFLEALRNRDPEAWRALYEEQWQPLCAFIHTRLAYSLNGHTDGRLRKRRRLGGWSCGCRLGSSRAHGPGRKERHSYYPPRTRLYGRSIHSKRWRRWSRACQSRRIESSSIVFASPGRSIVNSSTKGVLRTQKGDHSVCCR
jgi:hypothetical protein